MFLTFLSVTLLLLFYFYRKQQLNYWKNRNVPTLNPNVIFGDLTRVYLPLNNLSEILNRAQRKFRENGHKFGGLYFMTKPIFMPVDVEMVRLILVKDFDSFVNRGMYCDPNNDPLSGHILSLSGVDWKKMRKKLTPTFTSGKMKNMFYIIDKLTDKFCKVLKSAPLERVHMIRILEKLGVDVIGHVAFGLDCNTLENQDKELFEMTQRITRPSFTAMLRLIFSGALCNPGMLTQVLTSDKAMCSYFLDMIRETVNYRRSNQVRVNDFLQLLIDLHEDGQNTLTIEEIAAQSFLFFIAAFETSSKTAEFTLYELARNPDFQGKLRVELQEAFEENGGKIDYDSIMSNKLLDAFIKESLRKYPPVLYLNRECTKDYKIPNTNITLEKGTILIMSTMAFHYDEEYFEDPQVFDPTRFFEENASNIKPFSYIPFGEGPRNCIGMRFGYLQVKSTIAKLLLNFEFSINPKTVEPIKIRRFSDHLLFTPKNKIFFDISPV